jgi:hypothetical protein
VTDEEKINEKMQEIGESLTAMQLPNTRQGTDMDKLMATGNRLLRQKIEERIKAVSEYERQRAELVDRYRVQIERTRMEAEDQLRLLEQAHAANMGTIEALIDKLKLLRGA